jgi:cyclase
VSTVPETSLHGAPAEYPWGARPVADGVVAYLQPNGGLGEANVGLIVGDDAAVVVDTCWDHRQAKRMLAAIAPHLRDRPITTVINTHSNGDHWWGNALMPADATIITSQSSLDAMRAENPMALAAMRCGLQIAAKLPLPGPLGHSARDGAHEFAPFDFAGVRRRFPDTTFTGRTEITVGGRRLELREVGPAHTAGDLLVFDHESGVVVSGDILFIGVTPIMWQGPAANWVAALQQIIDFGPEAIIPGHGPVPSLTEVRELLAYFQWLAAESARFHAAGLDAPEAAYRMLRSPEFVSAPWSGWHRPELAVVGVFAEYRHLRGARTALNQLQMAHRMTEIGALGRRLARRAGHE